MGHPEGEPTHTDPPTDPPHTDPAPVTEPHHVSHEACTARMDGLQAKIDELSGTVDNIVQKGDPDSTPVHRPWTHYGSH